ncbi:MAG: nitrilase-related carbon-nitrogen hydrolase [Chloroflexota bacterium]
MQKKTSLTLETGLILIGLAALNFFVSGRYVFWVAAWIAPVLALRLLHSHGVKRGLWLVFWGTYVTTSIAWYGATPIWGLAHFIFMLVNIGIGLLPFLIDRLLLPRLRQPDGSMPFVATLIFPAATTAFEFVLSSTNPIGNFGALGYSQAALPVLVQSTALFGMLGLTFLLSWFASIVHWLWTYNRPIPFTHPGVIGYGFLLGAVIMYGAIRLYSAPDATGTLPMLVQTLMLFGMLGLTFLLSWFANITKWLIPALHPGVVGYGLLLGAVISYGTVRLYSAPAAAETLTIASFTLEEVHVPDYVELMNSDLPTFRAKTAVLHQRYLNETAKAAAEGAQLVLWPESAGIGISDDVDLLIEKGQALAQQEGIYLGLPYLRLFPDSEQVAENKLLVIEPNGNIGIEHVKYGGNLLEGTLAGNGTIQTLDTPFGRIAGIICWDTDFPETVRQVGEKGVDILLSPSNEWAGIDPMHAEMARFRAVENGVTLVRQADKGLSAVFDPYGRLLAQERGGTHHLAANITISGVATYYATNIKEVVGIMAIGILLTVAAYALSRKQYLTPAPEFAMGD